MFGTNGLNVHKRIKHIKIQHNVHHLVFTFELIRNAATYPGPAASASGWRAGPCRPPPRRKTVPCPTPSLSWWSGSCPPGSPAGPGWSAWKGGQRWVSKDCFRRHSDLCRRENWFLGLAEVGIKTGFHAGVGRNAEGNRIELVAIRGVRAPILYIQPGGAGAALYHNSIQFFISLHTEQYSLYWFSRYL